MERNTEKNPVRATEFVMDSSKVSVLTIDDMFDHGLDYNTMLESFTGALAEIQRNDFQCVEKMLLAQAKVLEIFFHKSLMCAHKAERIELYELHIEMALKAQNLSRKTLSTIVNIKNPKHPTFIKNQNNAINQQIIQAQEEKLKNFSQKCSNELLSEVNHETLDTGRESPTGSANSLVEAVAKGWSQNSSRKSSEPNERL